MAPKPNFEKDTCMNCHFRNFLNGRNLCNFRCRFRCHFQCDFFLVNWAPDVQSTGWATLSGGSAITFWLIKVWQNVVIEMNSHPVDCRLWTGGQLFMMSKVQRVLFWNLLSLSFSPPLSSVSFKFQKRQAYNLWHHNYLDPCRCYQTM